MSDFGQINVDSEIKSKLDVLVKELETHLASDVVTVRGPITYGLDGWLRTAVELLERPRRSSRVCVLLDTPGGVVEVVERMVELLRHFYPEVNFLIPDRAMSAGTVFAMAGDSIMMDYYSRLGPIDPQIEKDGRLVPALSYLIQFKRLISKAKRVGLSSEEFALLAKFDLAELHQYEQARNLTKTLLRGWLATYKFKNWTVTETRGLEVTAEMRVRRALEIAEALSDNRRWHSHGRGISMKTLKTELNLQIDDFSADSRLSKLVHNYHALLQDYCFRGQITYFIHTRNAA